MATFVAFIGISFGVAGKGSAADVVARPWVLRHGYQVRRLRRTEGRAASHSACSLGGISYAYRDHRSRPRPKKFQPIADQFLAKRGGAAITVRGRCAQAIPCSAVCIHPATLWRSAGAAARYLGMETALEANAGIRILLAVATRLRLLLVGLFY